MVSPGDRYTEVEKKASDWLRYGTQAVIIVDPARHSARIHRTGEVVNVTDAIAVDDIVPGWLLPLSEIFETSCRARTFRLPLSNIFEE